MDIPLSSVFGPQSRHEGTPSPSISLPANPLVVFDPPPDAPTSSQHASRVRQLYKCSRGEYPALWYQFKRFETLGLLDLYLYQDALVQLQSKIDKASGACSDSDIENLHILLHKYYKAIVLFKEISQMKRPSAKAREETASILTERLQEKHYKAAADALGMVDLTPQALGVEADSIRVFLARRASSTDFKAIQTLLGRPPSYLPREPGIDPALSRLREAAEQQEAEGTTQKVLQIRKPGEKPNGIAGGLNTISEEADGGAFTECEARGRPFSHHISPIIDAMARYTIALISGLLLLLPIIALSYIPTKGYRLLATCLSVILFAIVMPFTASKASNQELVVATAGYTAVLVVFLGQTSGNEGGN
jgi:hypothetical protein